MPVRRAVRAGEPLTPRELEILELMVTGATNGQIGASLGITANTVKVYASQIYKKLSVANRTAAVVLALETGLV